MPSRIALTLLQGRDPEYMKLNIRFTIDVVLGGIIINMFPHFLKPYVMVTSCSFPLPEFPRCIRIAGRLLTNVPKFIGVALKHLRPIIEERQQKIEEYGMDYPDKPVSRSPSNGYYVRNSSFLQIDMLSWLMDEAQGQERTTESLTRRILTLNFAAIHTSSMVCHCVFCRICLIVIPIMTDIYGRAI